MVEKIKKGFSVEKCILRAFAAWCFVNLVKMLFSEMSFTDIAFQQTTNMALYLFMIAAVFAVLSAVDIFFPIIRLDGKLLFVVMFATGIRTASDFQSFYYVFFLLVLFAIVIYYLIKNGDLEIPNFKMNDIATFSLIAGISFVFIVIVGGIGVLRYRTYSSPNFDFGLFCNMFHNMKEKLLPIASSERDAILSHFAVHISPVYYLLLPFYALFPTPETLQIGQTIILVSGVIPLYLICKKYDLSKLYTVLIAAAYLLYPALAGGTFYDIHENCFLTPLLLWTFYFFEKDKYTLMYVFAALTLSVKEDAAIYIAFFALYMILGRKKYKHGIITFVAACVYFIAVVLLLARFGTGAMSWRYEEYIYGNGGFIGIIKTVILNPSYVFNQFANADYLTSKLLYILQMLVPLAFMPFITKKISRYVLIFPFILMNLMPSWQYQYDIGFQYNFGVIAFFFWLTIMNIADLPQITKKFAVSFCATAAALMFTMYAIPEFGYYVKLAYDNGDTYAQMDAELATIEKDASVTCSTMLLAHLADRDEIYEVAYHDTDKEGAVLTDYVVLDMRYEIADNYIKYSKLGYEAQNPDSKTIAILKKVK